MFLEKREERIQVKRQKREIPSIWRESFKRTIHRKFLFREVLWPQNGDPDAEGNSRSILSNKILTQAKEITCICNFKFSNRHIKE